jgi:hypothetical protein
MLVGGHAVRGRLGHGHVRHEAARGQFVARKVVAAGVIPEGEDRGVLDERLHGRSDVGQREERAFEQEAAIV